MILGGVEIAHDRGLEGHSDADVLSHAIADSILGAMGKPDIGFYFPPSDASIEGICSLEILKKAAEVVREEGFEISNVDSQLIMEAPRVMPYAEQMRKNIANALGIQPSEVGIKATTNERLGFAGRKEGVAALASACLVSK